MLTVIMVLFLFDVACTCNDFMWRLTLLFVFMFSFFSPITAFWEERVDSSWKRLRIKVTPDLHLTYSKNGVNLGLVLKMKNIACLSILLTKHVK